MTISSKAWHQAGHLSVAVDSCHLAATPSRVTGVPWYAPAQPLGTSLELPADPAERREVLRNLACHRAVVAMAGVVAEAKHTCRKLSAVLASAAGQADEAYLRSIAYDLYGGGYARFQKEALVAAEEILSFNNHDLEAIARHPLTEDKPWELGPLLTRADALPPWFQMTVHGMPFTCTVFPHGPDQISVDALLPDGDMRITFEAPRSSSRAKIIKQIVVDITHYRLSLEHDYQRQLQAA